MRKRRKEEIFDLIIKYEHEAGESFVDRFGYNINEMLFMTWCFGKGYLSRKKYNLWIEAFKQNELEATDANYYVYNDEGEYGVPYAVIITDDWNEKAYHKAYMIIAEFISGFNMYQKRFTEFILDKES